MAIKNGTPVYLQVAVDVAGRIFREELVVGQKLIGRSTLASEYNVSPETIRKAMGLLSEFSIVEVKQGKGIHVASVERVEEFIERYKIRVSVNGLKEELIDLMKQRESIDIKMNEAMKSIIDYTSRFYNRDHISVNEYCINFEYLLYKKTLGELDLKHNTGITLVGIKRDDVMIISPEDDEIVMAKDKLQYVGDSSANIRLDEYIREVYESTNNWILVKGKVTTWVFDLWVNIGLI